MQKTLYLLLIGLLGVGCSKTEDPNPNTYHAVVRENFTSPYKQIENIQVGDYVPYTISLTDSKNIANSEYRLTSVRTEQTYHQIIGRDFLLCLNDDKSQVSTDEPENYISFTGKGTHNFYIHPLVPGTFKLTFELQKFVNNEPIGDAIKIKVSFNAVKISFGIYNHAPSIMGTSKKNYNYFLKIEDGEDTNDNYLSSKNITQTYTLLYTLTKEKEEKENEKSYTNTLTTNKVNLFNSSLTADKITIKHLKIRQSLENTPDFLIEYYNLNIILNPSE